MNISHYPITPLTQKHSVGVIDFWFRNSYLLALNKSFTNKIADKNELVLNIDHSNKVITASIMK